MVLYKEEKFFQQSVDAAFDMLATPGQVTPRSGIYKCVGCGHEIVASRGSLMPDDDHHPHSQEHGDRNWRLVAAISAR